MTEEEKRAELMQFLREQLFDPILDSDRASTRLTQGVRLTIMRMEGLSAAGMVQYYWSAIIGTEHSIRFAEDMRREGFNRFEDPETLTEFRRRFNDEWLRS
jgi:hypothetical protein